MKQLALGLSLAMILGATAPASADIEFRALMNGAQEAPPLFVTPALGSMTLDLHPGPDTSLSIELSYEDLIGGSVVGANFGDAPPGSNGPDVRDYDPGLFTSPSGTFIGTWSASDAQPLTPGLVQDLLLGNLYFDLSTQQFPTGEIRGQIERVPEPASLSLVLAVGGLALTSRRRKR